MTDQVRPRPTLSATRSEAHTLTTREVMKIFEAEGVPRAQRSIERYCQEGHLDCMPDAIEKRLYITRASVDILIGQLKEIATRHQHTNATANGQVGATADDMQRPPRTTTDEDAAVKRGTPEKHDGKQAAGDYEHQLEAMEKRIKELENEKFHLQIDKSAKEQVITTLREHMTQDRKDYTAQITHISRRVGQLETEMRQLKAPDRDRLPTPDDSRRPLEDDAAIDAEYRDADATTKEYHNDVSTNASQP